MRALFACDVETVITPTGRRFRRAVLEGVRDTRTFPIEYTIGAIPENFAVGFVDIPDDLLLTLALDGRVLIVDSASANTRLNQFSPANRSKIVTKLQNLGAIGVQASDTLAQAWNKLVSRIDTATIEQITARFNARLA